MWVRGLKHGAINWPIVSTIVAPRVGAWIETLSKEELIEIRKESHPVWVRGLKL